DALTAGQINTITDISGTIPQQYNGTLADRAALEKQLADVQQKIADTIANMSGSATDVVDTVASIPYAVDSITSSVDNLVQSSSQLRSFASSLLGLVSQLTLSDISPLSHRQRLLYAQGEYAAAQVQAENGDP